jgi:hypothetical protein
MVESHARMQTSDSQVQYQYRCNTQDFYECSDIDPGPRLLVTQMPKRCDFYLQTSETAVLGGLNRLGICCRI